MPAENELATYLNYLLEATVSKSMEWSKVNPTTFIWSTTTPKPGKVIIQRVQKRVMMRVAGRAVARDITKHLLQVVDDKGATVFSVDGSSNSSIEDTLLKVFEAIQEQEVEKGFEFFKGILPK